eukprot:sb/3460692/
MPLGTYSNVLTEVSRKRVLASSIPSEIAIATVTRTTGYTFPKSSVARVQCGELLTLDCPAFLLSLSSTLTILLQSTSRTLPPNTGLLITSPALARARVRCDSSPQALLVCTNRRTKKRRRSSGREDIRPISPDMSYRASSIVRSPTGGILVESRYKSCNRYKSTPNLINTKSSPVPLVSVPYSLSTGDLTSLTPTTTLTDLMMWRDGDHSIAINSALIFKDTSDPLLDNQIPFPGSPETWTLSPKQNSLKPNQESLKPLHGSPTSPDDLIVRVRGTRRFKIDFSGSSSGESSSQKAVFHTPPQGKRTRSRSFREAVGASLSSSQSSSTTAQQQQDNERARSPDNGRVRSRESPDNKRVANREYPDKPRYPKERYTRRSGPRTRQGTTDSNRDTSRTMPPPRSRCNTSPSERKSTRQNTQPSVIIEIKPVERSEEKRKASSPLEDIGLGGKKVILDEGGKKVVLSDMSSSSSISNHPPRVMRSDGDGRSTDSSVTGNSTKSDNPNSSRSDDIEPYRNDNLDNSKCDNTDSTDNTNSIASDTTHSSSCSDLGEGLYSTVSTDEPGPSLSSSYEDAGVLDDHEIIDDTTSSSSQFSSARDEDQSQEASSQLSDYLPANFDQQLDRNMNPEVRDENNSSPITKQSSGTSLYFEDPLPASVTEIMLPHENNVSSLPATDDPENAVPDKLVQATTDDPNLPLSVPSDPQNPVNYPPVPGILATPDNPDNTNSSSSYTSYTYDYHPTTSMGSSILDPSSHSSPLIAMDDLTETLSNFTLPSLSEELNYPVMTGAPPKRLTWRIRTLVTKSSSSSHVEEGSEDVCSSLNGSSSSNGGYGKEDLSSLNESSSSENVENAFGKGNSHSSDGGVSSGKDSSGSRALSSNKEDSNSEGVKEEFSISNEGVKEEFSDEGVEDTPAFFSIDRGPSIDSGEMFQSLGSDSDNAAQYHDYNADQCSKVSQHLSADQCSEITHPEVSRVECNQEEPGGEKLTYEDASDYLVAEHADLISDELSSSFPSISSIPPDDILDHHHHELGSPPPPSVSPSPSPPLSVSPSPDGYATHCVSPSPSPDGCSSLPPSVSPSPSPVFPTPIPGHSPRPSSSATLQPSTPVPTLTPVPPGHSKSPSPPFKHGSKSPSPPFKHGSKSPSPPFVSEDSLFKVTALTESVLWTDPIISDISFEELLAEASTVSLEEEDLFSSDHSSLLISDATRNSGNEALLLGKGEGEVVIGNGASLLGYGDEEGEVVCKSSQEVVKTPSAALDITTSLHVNVTTGEDIPDNLHGRDTQKPFEQTSDRDTAQECKTGAEREHLVGGSDIGGGEEQVLEDLDKEEDVWREDICENLGGNESDHEQDNTDSCSIHRNDLSDIRLETPANSYQEQELFNRLDATIDLLSFETPWEDDISLNTLSDVDQIVSFETVTTRKRVAVPVRLDEEEGDVDSEEQQLSVLLDQISRSDGILKDVSSYPYSGETISSLEAVHGNKTTSSRGDLERDWLRVTDESSKARGEISAQAELHAQFREKSEELKAWITEIRTKVSEFDPNDIETPATLSNDIQAIRAVAIEAEQGAAAMASVRDIGLRLQAIDSSAEYGPILDSMGDALGKVTSAINKKTSQFEEVSEDWETFRASVDEVRACVVELQELLQADDPIGPELEEAYEDITKRRKLLYDTCQGSMATVSNLGKKLVNRAGADATAILLSELNEAKDLWEETAGMCSYYGYNCTCHSFGYHGYNMCYSFGYHSYHSN